MAHDWLPYTNPNWGPGKMLKVEPHRQCKKCGAIQKRITENTWMRVTGYRWRPFAARCAGDADPLHWQVALHGDQKGTVQAQQHSEAVLLVMETHKLIDEAGLEVKRVDLAPVNKRPRGASGPKVHMYNYWVTADPLMPEHVREQYRREGLKGTLCGYVRPQTTTVSSEVTCFFCRSQMTKASA